MKFKVGFQKLMMSFESAWAVTVTRVSGQLNDITALFGKLCSADYTVVSVAEGGWRIQAIIVRTAQQLSAETVVSKENHTER